MPSYVKLAADAGDKYLSSLAEVQDAYLKSISTAAERFKAATTVATTPAFELPLPTPAEIAEANFAFAQKMLKQQKSFVEKFIATATSSN